MRGVIVGHWSRRLGTALLCASLLSVGCKTSDDAAAASTQMAATTKSLSDYYGALEKMVSDTDQIYGINAVLFEKPYAQENREQVKKVEDEIKARKKLAADFSEVSDEFAKLTGSKAPADVAKSAAKLQADCTQLAGVKESTDAQTAIQKALEFLVTAVQEKKERDAAKAIDQATQGLNRLFDQERPVWNSTQTIYNEFASQLASDLVDQNATDNAAMLSVALDPYGMVPSQTSTGVNKKLAPLAKQQIADRKAAAAQSYAKATDDMKKALQEMGDRIHAVAEDKAMNFRLPPLTIEGVEKWVAEVKGK